jgi:hypothetical protein
MPLIKQSAFISQSPITVNIGGDGALSVQPFVMAPSLQLYVEGQLVGTRNGKYVQSLNYYSSFGGAVPVITTISLPDLEGAYGDIFSSLQTSVTTIDAPELVFGGGACFSGSGASSYAVLTSINLPKLVKMVGSSFLGLTAANLTTLNLNSLVEALSISATFNSLTALNLPSLKTLTSSLVFSSTSTTSINLSSLVMMNDAITITASLCTTLTLPTLGVWKVLRGNFTATTCAFNQTTVDNILAALAYMDGTNGTFLFGSGRTVSITGTSSAPSNAGSTTTPGSNFVGATTTCTVNLTSHGYTTGDVLRVSGITTLTNANRYAVITVVNANQFTYAITSQTATGAGTATIVKANASAKALVTRSVSLTTN